MRTVGIVGGGVSGAAAAMRLLARAEGPAVLLFEPGEVGRGPAYSTRNPSHRLNVRAGRMSLLPERPDDFLRWLSAAAPVHADPEAFAPRGLYGDYVGTRFAEALAAAPGRLRRVPHAVTGLRPDAGRWCLETTDGGAFAADAVLLATGVDPPASPGSLSTLGEALIPDPWASGALSAVGPEDRVLLLGTGLTALDVLLSLQDAGWRGSAVALSRRGLLPRAHGLRHGAAVRPPLPDAPLSWKLRAFRRAEADTPWRALMEGLRPRGQALWTDLAPAERRRFLRHLRPWWDVCRHRCAPEIAARIEGLIAADRLTVTAGRLVRAEPAEDGLSAVVRPRGRRETAILTARKLILCTGPDPDLFSGADPLFAGLAADGLAGPDALRLGVDAAPDGRVSTRPGVPPLYATGALLKGVLWESVAVPELREQAVAVADALARELAPA